MEYFELKFHPSDGRSAQTKRNMVNHFVTKTPFKFIFLNLNLYYFLKFLTKKNFKRRRRLQNDEPYCDFIYNTKSIRNF